MKRFEGATYVVSVCMRGAAVRAAFDVRGLDLKAEAEALGEGRKIPVVGGKFEDDFGPYGVHLYRIRRSP